MNNVTFETIEKTIVRLEACLETDEEPTDEQLNKIADAVVLLTEVYENSKPTPS